LVVFLSTTNTSCSALRAGEFASFLRYARSLRFDEAPNYGTVRDLFDGLMKRHGLACDWKFDWIDVPLVSFHVLPPVTYTRPICVPRILHILEIRGRANVTPPGVVSPTGETIFGVEIPLVATPTGECNCISLHSMRSAHWVGKH